MNNSLHKISDLAFKYLKGELNAVEKEELSEYLAASENRLFFERLTSTNNINAKLEAVYDVEKEAIWQTIVAATPKLQKRKTIVMPPSLKYAAAVILVAALGAYVFMNRNKKQGVAKVEARSASSQNDILPGGNKAILTLADGRSIILDNVVNGNVATQGKTAIVKTADGQIAYNSKDALTDVYFNTVSTPNGGQYKLTLSDGSKIWINAASQLRFPTAFSAKERIVELDGEAYFEVAENPIMPFIVKLKNGLTVQVLGTHFNVMAYGEEKDNKTTLLEGSVKISNGSSVVMLGPGQQALSETGNYNAVLRINKDADTEEAIAWKNGIFQFQNADLKTVMRQVARWYDVEVSFDDRVSEKRFTGRMSRDLKASELLSGIEYIGVHFKLEGRKILVLP